jgi:hypothetical protein
MKYYRKIYKINSTAEVSFFIDLALKRSIPNDINNRDYIELLREQDSDECVLLEPEEAIPPPPEPPP